MVARPKESNINYGFSYKYKDFGNIDFTYTKEYLNISLSLVFHQKSRIERKMFLNPYKIMILIKTKMVLL